MAEIELSLVEGVARITLNRPASMNAMNVAMWERMLEIVQGIEHDPSVRCVLIMGAGENFCAGADVKEFAATLDFETSHRVRHWVHSAEMTNMLFLTLERIPQPVVASVRGVAAGGGMALVAAADLAIGADSAKMFAAQIKLGAIPDSGVSYNMVRSIGLKRAKQLGMLGDTIDAATALDFGLLNWVVPDDQLDARTEQLTARLARTPRTALALTKATFNQAWNESLGEHFQQEARDVAECVSADDFVQRVRGFVERAR